jgi:hypothetical protein
MFARAQSQSQSQSLSNPTLPEAILLKDAIQLLNPLQLETVDVILIDRIYKCDDGGEYAQIAMSRITLETRELGIARLDYSKSRSQPTCVIWGYISISKLRQFNPHIDAGSDTVHVEKKWTFKRPSFDAIALMQVDASFTNYQSLALPSSLKEVSLDEFQLWVLKRLALLKRAAIYQKTHPKHRTHAWPELDVDLSTEDAVITDNLSYFAILSLLSNLHVTTHITRHELRSAWLQSEIALARCRCNVMRRDVLVRIMFEEDQLVKAKSVYTLLRRVDPLVSTCAVKLPFEQAADILKHREGVALGGTVYFDARMCSKLYPAWSKTLHSHNLDSAISNASNYTQSDSRFTSLKKHVVDALVQLRYLYTSKTDDWFSSETPSRRTMQEVIHHSPLCMKQLHLKATVIPKEKQKGSATLKNTDRYIFAQLLLCAGVSRDAILNSWLPKIEVMYGDSAKAAEREAKQTIKWVEQKRTVPYRCEYLMSKGLCPMKTSSSVSAHTARAKCQRYANADIQSPVQYINAKIKASASSPSKPQLET